MLSPAIRSLVTKNKISRCCSQKGAGHFDVVVDVFHCIFISKVLEKLREERGQQ